MADYMLVISYIDEEIEFPMVITAFVPEHLYLGKLENLVNKFQNSYSKDNKNLDSQIYREIIDFFIGNESRGIKKLKSDSLDVIKNQILVLIPPFMELEKAEEIDNYYYNFKFVFNIDHMISVANIIGTHKIGRNVKEMKFITFEN